MYVINSSYKFVFNYSLVYFFWEKNKVITTLRNLSTAKNPITEVSFHPKDRAVVCVIGHGVFKMCRLTEGASIIHKCHQLILLFLRPPQIWSLNFKFESTSFLQTRKIRFFCRPATLPYRSTLCVRTMKSPGKLDFFWLYKISVWRYRYKQAFFRHFSGKCIQHDCGQIELEHIFGWVRGIFGWVTAWVMPQ